MERVSRSGEVLAERAAGSASVAVPEPARGVEIREQDRRRATGERNDARALGVDEPAGSEEQRAGACNIVGARSGVTNDADG